MLEVSCGQSGIDHGRILGFYENNFYEGSEMEGDDSAVKFAEWLGCNNPENEDRHPAREGTLIYGEECV